MSDKSFGATTRKLKQVTDQYYECRKAALAVDQPKEEKSRAK